jgi:putative copper resistance protein D
MKVRRLIVSSGIGHAAARNSFDLEGLLINQLIAVRDIHFGSSVIVAGIVFFDLFIASPSLRMADSRVRATMATFSVRSATTLGISLGLSIFSGFAWLGLVAARIASKPFGEVIADGTIWTVLSQTQFGFAWELRFLFGVLLAACLFMRWAKKAGASIGQEVLVALLAGAYIGSLAFAGHGEEGLGIERNLHLAADFFHLIAAGLWLGGLIPLALFLVCLRQIHEQSWLSVACDAAGRFSNLGILAVGILLVSGTINGWFLVGSMEGLIDTSYGRLLLLKITLFAAMVCLAGINREYLLPRLSGGIETGVASRALLWLIRSARVEIALGVGVILIVGTLGIMAPATDMHAHLH